MTSAILVIDVGTTGLRAALMRADGSIVDLEYRPFAPESPFPGLVEFDSAALTSAVLEAVATVRSRAGDPAIAAVGIANQRASTIVWDRASGTPVGPALGWQDLRTVGECLTAKAEHGIALAPNQPATKIAWLLANAAADRDPADLCFGTVDSWLVWSLTEGAVHVTDHTNAAVSGMYSVTGRGWDAPICEALGIDAAMLPTIVDTSGVVGAATAIPGAPPIAAIVGDQQGSLVGQGCVRPGMAKITFGTGGMLDVCLGSDAAPATGNRSEHGTFPIVAWSHGGNPTWGAEGIMLSAGTNVEWLHDDLGIIDSPAASHDVAAACSTSDGVVYVPALLGLGTPHWDYGARGTLLGVTRGTERSHVVRAVLEGIAQRGADLVEAAVADTGRPIETLRIDGGMSANPTFVQALADATQSTIEVSPTTDATTVGAGLLAGVAIDIWPDLGTAAGGWRPAGVVAPGDPLDRDMWARAVERASGWFADLSALDF